MLCKYFGLILIFIGIAAAGFKIASGYRRECRTLAAFGNMIQAVGRQIGSFRTPLPELFERYAESAEPELSDFLKDVKEHGFSDAVETIVPGLSLPPQAENSLRDLAKTLGKSDAEDQEKRCLACAELISLACREAEERLPTRLRLCRTLSLSCAAMAVLILL